MISRRQFGALVLGAAVGSAAFGPATVAAAKEPARLMPEMNDDGLYYQPWFLNSFLVLEEDLAEAASKGKRLAIFFEQKGCPYCKEMHLVNLADPEINAYIRDNFEVLQINLWGARKVTDFDGEELEERALARKWGVVFTPTIVFVEEDMEKIRANGGKSEVARMPGYFKPFHFLNMFQYVKEKAYTRQHFQRYIQDKAERMRAKGIEVKIW